MKLVIAGSRGITSKNDVQQAIEEASNAWGFDVLDKTNILISGDANGVDTTAIRVLVINDTPITLYLPDWDKGGRAGPLRNKSMAKTGDRLIAIWDGESSGTKSMINAAKKHMEDVYVYRTDTKTLGDF